MHSSLNRIFSAPSVPGQSGRFSLPNAGNPPAIAEHFAWTSKILPILAGLFILVSLSISAHPLRFYGTPNRG